MSACARRDIVIPEDVAVYHCWSRCAQAAWLFGTDPVTRHDYGYRRQWVRQTEQMLAQLFAVEVAFYACMENHVHLILRTRPDVAAMWSDRDVVRRWLIIAKLKRNGLDHFVEPREAEIVKQLNLPGRVDKLRLRLSAISWFMGALCENISRRCNRESGRRGALWEGRYGCRRLLDEAAILVGGIYVDLNVLRAGVVETPEDSLYTSAHDRIEGLRQRVAGEALATTVQPDQWLCELTIAKEVGSSDDNAAPRGSSLRASDKGLLDMTLEDYLQLLDRTGREIRADKPGAIPESLAPILDRLGINRAGWLEAVASFDSRFGHVVGPVAKLAEAARRAGRRWFRGKSHCARMFC